MNTCMCVVGVCAHSCVCLVPGGHHLLELELYIDGCKLSWVQGTELRPLLSLNQWAHLSSPYKFHSLYWFRTVRC